MNVFPEFKHFCSIPFPPFRFVPRSQCIPPPKLQKSPSFQLKAQSVKVAIWNLQPRLKSSYERFVQLWKVRAQSHPIFITDSRGSVHKIKWSAKGSISIETIFYDIMIQQWCHLEALREACSLQIGWISRESLNSLCFLICLLARW